VTDYELDGLCFIPGTGRQANTVRNIRWCVTFVFITSLQTSSKCLSQSLWRLHEEMEGMSVIPCSFGPSDVTYWTPYLCLRITVQTRKGCTAVFNTYPVRILDRTLLTEGVVVIPLHYTVLTDREFLLP
jgi:hypothetical protein